MSDPTEVRIERIERVAELVIDRPDRGNSITGPVVEGLIDGLAQLTTDPGVGAIVLRGEGRLFCGGLDTEAFFGGQPPPWRSTFRARWAALHRALFVAETPIVVAVEQAAIAAGCGLMLAGDFIVADKTARVHILELERALMAPINLAWLLAKHEPAVATRLVLGARVHPADELHALGVVDQLCLPGAARDTALELALRLASFDRHLTGATKRIIRAPHLARFDSVIDAAQAAAPGVVR